MASLRDRCWYGVGEALSLMPWPALSMVGTYSSGTTTNRKRKPAKEGGDTEENKRCVCVGTRHVGETTLTLFGHLDTAMPEGWTFSSVSQ
jgi:hypothetical protein